VLFFVREGLYPKPQCGAGYACRHFYRSGRRLQEWASSRNAAITRGFKSLNRRYSKTRIAGCAFSFKKAWPMQARFLVTPRKRL